MLITSGFWLCLVSTTQRARFLQRFANVQSDVDHPLLSAHNDRILGFGGWSNFLQWSRAAPGYPQEGSTFLCLKKSLNSFFFKTALLASGYRVLQIICCLYVMYWLANVLQIRSDFNSTHKRAFNFSGIEMALTPTEKAFCALEYVRTQFNKLAQLAFIR